MEIREIGMAEIGAIKAVIDAAFSQPPWNDDWSDDENFTQYIIDVIGNGNSLCFGLFLRGELIGVSLGRVKHWFHGAEYEIDDICIHPDHQGRGIGSRWIAMVESALRERGIAKVCLITRRDAPAFDYYRKNGYDEVAHDVVMKKGL